MEPDCEAWLSRWRHNPCYCSFGRFYGPDDAARGLANEMPHPLGGLAVRGAAASAQWGDGALSVRADWLASRQALEEVQHELQEQLTQLAVGGWANSSTPDQRALSAETTTELCSVRGLELWGVAYLVYFLVAMVGFAVPLVLSGQHLRRMCRRRGGELILPRAMQGCCLAAVGLRVEYMIAQFAFVYAPPENVSSTWEKITQVSYSLFFPLAAAAFLCVCQLWSKHIAALDNQAPSPWHRNPLVAICLIFATFEVFHSVSDLWGYDPVFDAVYFLWMALVSVAVTILGLRIARQLYIRLQGVYRTDQEGGRQLYQKTMVSAGLVSAVAICYLGLCIVYALDGRFYAWPCLICWATARLLEALYLVVVVLAAGSATPGAAAEPQELSFAPESFVSEASTEQGSQVATSSWAMWISGDTPTHRDRGNFQDHGDSFRSGNVSR